MKLEQGPYTISKIDNVLYVQKITDRNARFELETLMAMWGCVSVHEAIQYAEEHFFVLFLWPIDIKTPVVETCGGCPSVYEGKLIDGRDFRIRYRYGKLSLRIDDEMVFLKVLGDSLDGVIGLEEAMKHCPFLGY